jgi:tetratricopeptide (TPR) repeat protein
MSSPDSSPSHYTNAFTYLPKRYPRESTLLLILVMLIALFVITGIFTKAFHEKEAGIAEDWFIRGNAALAAGRSREARDDFRNALMYEPQSAEYQLHLAQALAAFGQPDQARAYLINLLNQSPADGQVNLELARLAAHDDRISDAIHYYHGAIYGFVDNPTAGLNARLEFGQFLVDVGDISQANGELTALSANVPPSAAGIHSRIGDLLVRSAALQQALAEYQIALRASENAATFAKAGAVAYRLGNFKLAESYLSRVPANTPNLPLKPDELNSIRQVSRMIVDADPLAADLSSAERAHRAAIALAQVIGRVSACLAHLPAKDSEGLRASLDRARYMRNSDWSERNLLENPDRVHPAAQYVFDLEANADSSCGPAQGMDLALSVMARSHVPTAAPAVSPPAHFSTPNPADLGRSSEKGSSGS